MLHEPRGDCDDKVFDGIEWTMGVGSGKEHLLSYPLGTLRVFLTCTCLFFNYTYTVLVLLR